MAIGRPRDREAVALTAPARARRKFLRYFAGGFADETYLDWERDYKVESHERWMAALPKREMARLLDEGEHAEVGARAVRVEQKSRHSMLFSFEKMALRDALKSPGGARIFAEGLYDQLYGKGSPSARFARWVDAVERLPRRQTRVLTWPLVTVWGFLAQPSKHVFVKPNTIRRAAEAYGVDLPYRSRPNWETYEAVLGLAKRVRSDLADLGPRDMIDAQSFLWVQGSDEYP